MDHRNLQRKRWLLSGVGKRISGESCKLFYTRKLTLDCVSLACFGSKGWAYTDQWKGPSLLATRTRQIFVVCLSLGAVLHNLLRLCLIMYCGKLLCLSLSAIGSVGLSWRGLTVTKRPGYCVVHLSYYNKTSCFI